MMRSFLPFILVNSVWQVSLLGVMTALLVRTVRNTPASVRYAVWAACLALCITMPIATTIFPVAGIGHLKSVKTLFLESTTKPVSIINEVQIAPPGVLRLSPRSNQRMLSGLWFIYLATFSLGTVRLLSSAVRTNMLIRRARALTSPPFAESIIRNVLEEHGGVDQIEVLTTDLGISPSIVEWPHTILILPTWLKGSSQTELRSVLSHEFAHLRRRDFQLNVLFEIAIVVLFFHPVAHWIKSQIDESREASCDEAAARSPQGSKSYATALLSLSQRGPSLPPYFNLSLGITKTTHLEKRIMYILNARPSMSSFRRGLTTAACAVGMLAIVSGVAGVGFHPAVRAAVRKIEVKTAPDVLIPVSARKPAPDFTLPDADGQPISLSKYKGKVVLVNFWATWCGGCKLEIPWYIDFDKKYRSKGLQIIGVSMDGDGWKAVKPFLAKKMDDETGGYIAMKYPVVIGNDSLANSFGLKSMPMSILIDRSGRVAISHAGVVDRASFEANIQELLR